MKTPLTVACVLTMLMAAPTLALAAIPGGPLSQLTAMPPPPKQAAADDRWHGRGYGPYPYPGPYWRPYNRPPVVVVPGPVIVGPAPVIVSPPPVYAYPAPVLVPAPAPVANQIICRGSNNGAILGGAIGGTTGAVVGAAVAHHHSWEAATGGAILGLLLGGAVGRAVDAGDQYCTTQAIVAAPIGQPVYWTNPAYGRQYQIVPMRQYQAWGTTCRDFQASVMIDGRWQQIHGTACLQPDGSWQTVSG